MSSPPFSNDTEKEKRHPVFIYTDGACSGNPGPGGWGAVLRYKGKERHINGWSSHTTNNRMELLAAQKALETLKRPCEVVLTTDSQYLKQGITRWLEQWKKRNWLTTSKKAVKNKELWMMLDRLCSMHKVSWHWVKGHNGHPENELADNLARDAIKDGGKGLIKEDIEGNL